VRDLYESNDKLGKMIQIGQEIVVPIPEGRKSQFADDLPKTGQKSYVTASRTSYASVPPNSTKISYTVRMGDTVGEIAEWFNTYARKVREWNNIGNMIRVGQKLTIYVPNGKAKLYADINSMTVSEKKALGKKSKNYTGPVNFASADVDGFVTYKVKNNDNLFDIATSFGTSVQDIKQLNNLRKNTIYPGQVLKIKEKK
jgi:membrane-bound lytic murein transglycosylase D